MMFIRKSFILLLAAAFAVAVIKCDQNIFQLHSTPSLNYLSNNDHSFFSWLKTKKVTLRKANTDYYYSKSSLGKKNVDITLGNPMKGVIGDGIKNLEQWPKALPSSMQAYKIPFDKVMLNDPNVVGQIEAFNWTSVDEFLQICSSYKRHAIIRFFLHWPRTKTPVYLPKYLTQVPYKVEMVKNRNETIPYWADPILLNAIQQFITAFGKRYDGDKRLFVVQAGLIGAWGEHHSQGCIYEPTKEPCDPVWVYEKLVDNFLSSFTKTKIQFRYPNLQKSYNAKFGYHDDSYTKMTLSGQGNGNVDRKYAFWNIALANNMSDFWKWAPMGGEVHPENDDCFKSSYPANTDLHQDFQLCTVTTHATYMSWNRGFSKGGVGNGNEQNNAMNASARMGYNYIVQNVRIAYVGNNKVNVDVTIQHVGVAPFYYDLDLSMFCDNGVKKASTPIPNDKLQQSGDVTTISLKNVVATTTCFSSIELTLGSSYTYSGKPILWAQGSDGRVILNNVPLPKNSTIQPSPLPVRTPIPATVVPVGSPMNPAKVPTQNPNRTSPTRNPIPVLVPATSPTTIVVPIQIPNMNLVTKPTRKPSPVSVPNRFPAIKPTQNPRRVPILNPNNEPTLIPTPVLAPALDPIPTLTQNPVQRPSTMPIDTNYESITACYVTCAGTTCNETGATSLRGRFRESSHTRTMEIANLFNRRGRVQRNEQKILVRNNFKRIPLSLVGHQASFLCSIASLDVVTVQFDLPDNVTTTSRIPPYTINGTSGPYLTPAPYLSTPGLKTITVRVFDKNNVPIDIERLFFWIV